LTGETWPLLRALPFHDENGIRVIWRVRKE